MEHVRQLKLIRACSSAIEFAAQFETLQAAWNVCERPDWMFWLIGKTSESKPWSDERKPLVRCAVECAETVKHLWPEESRAQMETAISALKSWCNGVASLSEAQAARNSLRVAYVAYAAAAADAYAAAAADAAAAAAAAAAAYDAADAAYAAADAAAAAACDAYVAVRKECADIIRKHYPQAPQMKEVA